MGQKDNQRSPALPGAVIDNNMETADSTGLIDDSSWVTQKLWPRRLLEVSTMTSFERQPGNVYAGETEPKYSIVSYTWGRYTVPDGQRLPVHGITWQTPAIDESKFKIEDFSHMLRKAAGSNRFIWVDIACIDQDNYAVKMEEVGRQAGIFANADQAFVWIWTLPGTALQESMSPIIKYGFHLGEVLIDYGDTSEMSAAVHSAVNRVLNDPWFTSLWTLQEGFLREDAVFLAKDARHVLSPRSTGCAWPDVPRPTVTSNTMTVYSFTDRLWITLEFLEVPRGPFHSDGLERINKATAEQIYRTGYNSPPSENPNVQYGRARFRKTTYEVDRIYGIMAAYNISVGAAAPGADVKRVYTLPELQEEFAIAINAKSALLGQLFVHLSQPCEGKTWQITQESRVPPAFSVARQHLHPPSFTVDDCVIRPVEENTAKTMRIEGPVCSLAAMISCWEAWREHDRDYMANLILDDYLSENDCLLPRRNPRDEAMSYGKERINSISLCLLELFGAEMISVLRLGTIGGRWKGPYQYGLILLHDRDRQEVCQRLGICMWSERPRANQGASNTPRQPQWESYQGFIL